VNYSVELGSERGSYEHGGSLSRRVRLRSHSAAERAVVAPNGTCATFFGGALPPACTLRDMGSEPPNMPGWTRVLPYACLVAAALMAILVAPPTRLTTFIGSETWASIGMGLICFVALFLILIILGLAAGQVGLPFGLSVGAGNTAVSDVTSASLTTHLDELRKADERLFMRIGELTTVLSQALHRLQELEQNEGAP
jgi:hypothetical protein